MRSASRRRATIELVSLLLPQKRAQLAGAHSLAMNDGKRQERRSLPRNRCRAQGAHAHSRTYGSRL
jgi:hypothetical protein